MKAHVKRIARRIGAGLVVLLAALLATGKLTGFGCAGKPSWVHNAPATSPVPTEFLAGNWRGQWTSTENDMGGALTAHIEKIAPASYQADFDAVFAKIFTSKQSVVLNVNQKDGTWQFSGQADLGFLKGGVYTYNGQTDGLNFKCTYDSKFDKGHFEMKRLVASTQGAGEGK